MRELTNAEIEKLAGRAGVRRSAVENFLGTLGHAGSKRGEFHNLFEDAARYDWNVATIRAIEAGIKLTYKEAK